MVCKICQSQRMRRLERVGFLHRRLAPLFGFFPWRCSHCGTVQLLRARGKRQSPREMGNPHREAAGHSAEPLRPAEPLHQRPAS
jgi:hypothetical protein